jgi:photosystem II stability/assembly factor-like uncharacterized protein
MKQASIFIVFCLFSWQSIAQDWNVLPESPTSERFEDIYFTDAQTGWLVSKEGKMYHTTDGGLQWEKIYDEPEFFFRSLEFLDDQTGFAGTLSRALLRTTDGGKTWTDIIDRIPHDIRGVCGLSHVGQNVYGVGVWYTPAFFIKSTDGGETWTYKDLSDLAGGLVDVHFFNKNVGVASGIIESEGGVILRTTDGGENWKLVHNTNRGLEYIWKLDFLNDKVGYGSVASYVGNTTIVVKTTDGGKTWTELEVDAATTGLETQGLGFATEKLGWTAPKRNGMFETRDGGQTWTERDDLANVNRFFRLSEDLIYASGSYVYKYGDGDPNAVPDPLLIEESELFEVSPNPFRDELKITVGIEKPSFAKVDLFDLQGRHLASIYDDEFPPGERTFTVDPDVLAQLPAATYVVLLRTHGGFRKIWVVKQ